MSTVRCKFICQSKREYRGWAGQGHDAPLYDYEFTAVTDGKSEENKMFFAFTPSGRLNVSTVTDGQFQVGKPYYLDLTLADA